MFENDLDCTDRLDVVGSTICRVARKNDEIMKRTALLYQGSGLGKNRVLAPPLRTWCNRRMTRHGGGWYGVTDVIAPGKSLIRKKKGDLLGKTKVDRQLEPVLGGILEKH